MPNACFRHSSCNPLRTAAIEVFLKYPSDVSCLLWIDFQVLLINHLAAMCPNKRNESVQTNGRLYCRIVLKRIVQPGWMHCKLPANLPSSHLWDNRCFSDPSKLLIPLATYSDFCAVTHNQCFFVSLLIQRLINPSPCRKAAS